MWSVSRLSPKVLTIATPASQSHLASCRPTRVTLLFSALVALTTCCVTNNLEAGITNGDFEANSYTDSPTGWTASGVFITTHVSVEKPGIISDVSNGTLYADFTGDLF